jgi:hypothetical protein
LKIAFQSQTAAAQNHAKMLILIASRATKFEAEDENCIVCAISKEEGAPRRYVHAQ